MSPARTCTVLALLAAVAFAQTEPDAAVTPAAGAEPQAAAAVTQSNEPTAVPAATAAAPLAAVPTEAAPTAALPTPAAPIAAAPTAAAPTGAAAHTPPAVVTPAPEATLPDVDATPPSSDNPDATGSVTSPPTAAASSPADPSTAAAAPSSPSLPTEGAPTTAGAASSGSSLVSDATPTATDSPFSTAATSVPPPGTDASTPLGTDSDTEEATEAARDGAPWPVLVAQEPRSVRVREGGNTSLACVARGARALLQGARVSWHRHSPHGERVEHRAGHSELSQDDGDHDGDGEDGEEEAQLRAHLLMLQVLESRDEGAFYCVVTSSSGDETSHGEGSTLLISARHTGWRGLGDGVLGALGAACAGVGVLLGSLVALVPGVRDKLACGKGSSVEHV